MTKADEYRNKLSTLENWDAFLLKESGLPGPRGNLELAQVVADEGNQGLFERYLAYDADQAPTNSPYEFLAFCGAVGTSSIVCLTLSILGLFMRVSSLIAMAGKRRVLE